MGKEIEIDWYGVYMKMGFDMDVYQKINKYNNEGLISENSEIEHKKDAS